MQTQTNQQYTVEIITRIKFLNLIRDKAGKYDLITREINANLKPFSMPKGSQSFQTFRLAENIRRIRANFLWDFTAIYNHSRWNKNIIWFTSLEGCLIIFHNTILSREIRILVYLITTAWAVYSNNAKAYPRTHSYSRTCEIRVEKNTDIGQRAFIAHELGTQINRFCVWAITSANYSWTNPCRV